MFEVGDRVICLDDFDEAPIKGREATIVYIYSSRQVALDFGSPLGGEWGHSCGARTSPGCGWNVPMTSISKVESDNRTPIERKCRRLWNKSKWVQQHKQVAY